MIEEDYLTKSQNGKLLLGNRMRKIAHGFVFSQHHNIIRHQILESAARHFGETINLSIPLVRGMTYIDRVETGWPLRIQFAVGDQIPFHCTASGKVYLASIVKSERRKVVERLDLRRFTANTICDTDSLHKELDMTATQGFALDREEFLHGMVAAAVPVIGDEGRFAAALSLHAPTQRLSFEDAASTRHTLLDCAKQLGQIF